MNASHSEHTRIVVFGMPEELAAYFLKSYGKSAAPYLENLAALCDEILPRRAAVYRVAAEIVKTTGEAT